MGNKMRVQKLFSGQFTVTIPKSFVEVLDLKGGDLIEWSLNKKMELVLRKIKNEAS